MKPSTKVNKKTPGKSVNFPERIKRAKSLKFADPLIRLRVDMVHKAIGEVMPNSSIIRLLMAGVPEKDMPPVSQSQAYDYLKRGMLELESALTEERATSIAKTIARLETIQRRALQDRRYADAMAASDRLSLHRNIPNPLTSARSIHVTDQPPPDQVAGSLTTAELEALVARELKKTKD